MLLPAVLSLAHLPNLFQTCLTAELPAVGTVKIQIPRLFGERLRFRTSLGRRGRGGGDGLESVTLTSAFCVSSKQASLWNAALTHTNFY